MNTKKCIIISILLGALLSTPSLASDDSAPGWGKTRWGMTVEEVKTCLGNQIQIDKKGEIYIPNYQAGNYLFNVYFGFTEKYQKGGLVNVYLTLQTSQKAYPAWLSLSEVLTQKYGTPLRNGDEAGGIMKISRWRTEHNFIELVYLSPSSPTSSGALKIEYTPTRIPGFHDKL